MAARDHAWQRRPTASPAPPSELAARIAERPDHDLATRRRRAAKAITIIAAVPIVTPSSPAICGSSGSQTRRLAALANEASARRAMARVGVAPASVDVVGCSPASVWQAGAVGRAGPLLRGGCGGCRVRRAERQVDDTCPCQGRAGLLADAVLAVAAVPGEVEVEVVAVVGVVVGAEHRGEHVAGAAMHSAQEIALGATRPTNRS